jgi:DNA modification methylase
MAHKSENSKRLGHRIHKIRHLEDLCHLKSDPTVLLMVFPPGRIDSDASSSKKAFEKIEKFCLMTNKETTVCILTSSPDAARLLPFLEKSLHYQLWIAVKTNSSLSFTNSEQLPQKHGALLILTRYKGSLRHTLTRIAYTYCPACGKTTKDYGGKKHIYNPYGTLLSDVWRDIECDISTSTKPVEDRLQDLFGLSHYENLEVLDLRNCSELSRKNTFEEINDKTMPLFRGKGSLTGSKLINEDCLKALSTIPESSVDFCFADPPYNIQKKYDHWNDGLETQEYFTWCDKWLSELARVLKPNRTLAVINIPLWAVRHYQHLCEKLDFQAWIAWDGLSLPVRMIMPSHYAIICFSKGPPRPMPGLDITKSHIETILPMAEFYCVRQSCVVSRNNGKLHDRAEFSDLWYDIHRLKHNSRRADHPCQLPPTLMRRLFALFTKPGERILDCFDGAGTSTLVARQMDREFVGIELSTQYHKIAQERHDMISRGEDPFGKRESIPQAKNSRVERLPKQQYKVSKKNLQLEVRQIAKKLGRLPNRDEVKSMSKYPITYFDDYFSSWGEVCAAARHDGMSELPEGKKDEIQQFALF